jgi:hypothetical protein
MATPYQAIYDVFLSKISDYNLSQMDDATLTSILRGYLGSAIVNFKNCKKDLSQRDESNATFTIDLSDDEIEILALYMVDQWYQTKLNDDKALNQVLTDKDFQIYSQQAHTKVTMELRDANWARIKKLIKDYQYDRSDFSNLSTNKVQPDSGISSPRHGEGVVIDYYAN